jgi:UMF1 family MFS transporter
MSDRIVRAWCLYDWANSAFATTVMAALFPPFFRSAAIAGGLAPGTATAAWGYTTATALLLIAAAAPLLGAIGDASGRRKGHLAGLAGLGIVATGSFLLIGPDDWPLAAGLFMVANVGFAGSIVFYESLLPSVAAGGSIDRISARGYAYGYLGGGLLLAMQVLWVGHPEWFGLSGTRQAVQAAFLSVAIWWAVFSLPLLRRVPEPPGGGHATGGLPLVDGLRRLRGTLREIRRYRELALFLAAFWLYSDGIGTIIKMATAYGDELGIGLSHMTIALLATQFVGVPATLLFGRLAARWGARGAIQLALAIYLLILLGGFFMRTALHFYMLAIAVGLVQGGAQSLSRSLFGAMVPRHKTAEFFGFFSTSMKFAGIAGPLLFGLVGQLTGESRWSLLSLGIFFLVGGLLLSRVDVAAGMRTAQEAKSA